MKKKWKQIILILSIVLLLPGCSDNEKDNKDDIISEEIKIERNEKDLVIWSHYEVSEDIINGFNEKYPDVNIKVRVFPFSEYQKYYLAALSTNEVPDIMIMDSTGYASFNTLDVFENFLDEQYSAGDYKDDFDEDMWKVGLSFDGKSLIGLPFASAPVVTYYRADIMEEYGFPSDPEELGKYMENPDNWLEIGKKFKEDGRYLCQWVADPVTIVNSSMGYFDWELNYLKDNDTFANAIDIARRARSLGVVAFKDIWSDDGQTYIKNGKLPILYLGSWGAKQLEQWVPEQSGKWRTTRLPFNTYGWNNSTLISIPKKAIKKQEAWLFTQYYTFEQNKDNAEGCVPAYKPLTENNTEFINHTNEFLGGQKDQKLYSEVLLKTHEYPVTSLDEKAYKIWVSKVNSGLEQGKDTESIMENIKKVIEGSMKTEKEILLDSIKK